MDGTTVVDENQGCYIRAKSFTNQEYYLNVVLSSGISRYQVYFCK